MLACTSEATHARPNISYCSYTGYIYPSFFINFIRVQVSFYVLPLAARFSEPCQLPADGRASNHHHVKSYRSNAHRVTIPVLSIKITFSFLKISFRVGCRPPQLRTLAFLVVAFLHCYPLYRSNVACVKRQANEPIHFNLPCFPAKNAAEFRLPAKSAA